MTSIKTYETEQLKENKTEVYEYSIEEIKAIKMEFLDQLFEMKVNLYNNKELHQWVNTEMVCTNEHFHSWLMALRSRKFRSIPQEEFMSEAVAIITHSIMGYKGNAEGGFNWIGLLTAEESELNQIFGYLKLPIETGMLDFRNYWNHTIKKEKTIIIDGDKEVVNLWQRTNFNSLDQTEEFEDGTSGEAIVNLLGAESGLYFQDEYEDEDGNLVSNYQASHFLQWFREKYSALKAEIKLKREREEEDLLAGIKPKKRKLKNSFLTESQFDFLEARLKYPEFHCESFNYHTTEDDEKKQTFEDLTGINRNVAHTYKKNIINRIRKQFEKDNPLGKKTNLQLRKEKQIEFWSDFIYLVYCEENMIKQQNELLSSFIVNNMDNTFMSDILYDNLQGEDIFNVVSAIGGGTIRGETLYKIVDLVEKKLNFLETFDTSAVKFYRKKSEDNNWPKERHVAWAKEQAEKNAEHERVRILKWSEEANDYIEVEQTEEVKQPEVVVNEVEEIAKKKKRKNFRENLMTTGATYKVDSEAEIMKG